MKILYVEDNAVNLSLIQRIAQMHKHELVSYEEAEVALEKLEAGLEVDIILLDIQLAGEMSGIDFAKAFRARGWQQPIIAITAYAMLGDKERILEAGCNDYLPKPLPIAEFLTLLARYDPSVNSAETETPAVAPASPATEAPDTDESPKTQPLPPRAAAKPSPPPAQPKGEQSIWASTSPPSGQQPKAPQPPAPDQSVDKTSDDTPPNINAATEQDTQPFVSSATDQDTVPISTNNDEKKSQGNDV
ncbi:MAG: response regulator [Anaerolineales bacterium]